MSALAGSFKEQHTSLGVFYPLHYMVAVFPDLRTASQVKRQLWGAGFADDAVIVADGKEFLEFEKQETSLPGCLMQELSRRMGGRYLPTMRMSTPAKARFL